jgi:hypothetical protein
MFDTLTTTELTVLQGMLYEGTTESYRVTRLGLQNAGWFAAYRPVHSEIGQLFIEAGTELVGRLDQHIKAA